MGWLIREAAAYVALVGVEDSVSRKLRDALTKEGADDPGRVNLHTVRTIAECRELLERQELTAICINIDDVPPANVVTFIADLRTSHPLITFCLAGSASYLQNMPGFHKNWRERFRHYFQLRTDVNNSDFAENAGALRDLLIADVVKSKALGQYHTTPGALIRLKAASPYGFWLTLFALLVTAILGGAVGPLMDRFFPVEGKHSSQLPTGGAKTAGE